LAIFQGGFERKAAAQVAGATLLSLSALVSKSLVRRTKEGRYDLHEVVRQYALAQLADGGHLEAVRDRHCDYYLRLLGEREKDLRSAALREALRELTDEIENVRTAWSRAIGQGLRTPSRTFSARWWSVGMRPTSGRRPFRV
jgi:predicted ATPase